MALLRIVIEAICSVAHRCGDTNVEVGNVGDIVHTATLT